MEKRWTLIEIDEEKVEALHTQLKINKTLCHILVSRGLNDFEKAKHFFRPQLEDLHDPFLMKDMRKAVARLDAAMHAKERILVFGDYDVDGTTSVALMYQFLCSIYDEQLLDYYIPHRYREGYGVSKMGIDYAKEKGVTLIISLDCGIKSVELVAYAKTLGIDFIICDHHLPDEELPQAVAILNAKQVDCNYPYKELCGCGVGFKFASAVSKYLNLDPSLYLKYLDLLVTAIGADIVPITGENRILAYYGLQKINESPCAGIQALLKLSKIQKKLSVSDVVFVLAPKINAAGRMDDAEKAVQLFVEQDAVKAEAIAALLHSDNSDRREADESITEQALEQLIQTSAPDKKTTVVYSENWHKGVVGIVASRLTETYYRPTVVLTKSGEIAAGSARSVVGFNLYEAIHACREYLLGYGGHFAAAGLTLDPKNIPTFAEKFEQVVSASITANLLIPEILIDAEIKLSDINNKLYNIIMQMDPFGPENMTPIFVARGVMDKGYSKIVKEKHLRFVIKQGDTTITGIGFGLAKKFAIVEAKKPFDIVFKIDENEWQGQKNLQIMVTDIKASE